MRLQLLPYLKIDGVRTAKDSDLEFLYNKMVEDNTLHSVLYDNYYNVDSFVQLCKRVQLYFVLLDDKLAGFIYLTNTEGNSGRFHFCAFKEYWGNDLPNIANECIRVLYKMTQLKTLIGVVPVVNKLAIRLMKKTGMRDVGVIPNFCYLFNENKTVGGQILQITEEV